MNFYRFQYLLLGLLVASCASLPAQTDQDNFADYEESIFRHQNQLNSRLMMLTDAELIPDDEQFDNAEETMHEACHLLNEYAEHESSGESMSWLFKSKVQASIENCATSITRMESLLTKAGLNQ